MFFCPALKCDVAVSSPLAALIGTNSGGLYNYLHLIGRIRLLSSAGTGLVSCRRLVLRHFLSL
jgi:hypothetical protein